MTFSAARKIHLRPLHSLPDAGSKGCFHFIRNLQRARGLEHDSGELLLCVRGIWWQRYDMPVEVGVALVRAKRENVHQLGPYFRSYRPSDAVEDSLQFGVLLDPEIAS